MCKPCNVKRYQPPSYYVPIWMQSKENQEAFIQALLARLEELMDARFGPIKANVADMKADIANVKAKVGL